ncbi:MarR family transcriptional regulator [Malaciobacter molluscorum LMG 25693]|uniref:MarR family transcriptional regulator n=1 Tax=Malaciobacter molluscorum LMG 25693 TaxID=870501 RepID=A0A2G1DM51_9BACT|nr:MarR family winged helix-turn-helix transcriptional regulator [Malaciobacter molluscorum]AXX92227.1 transcriptional regulator, MarR family [Malaciobacter molluscorum LMG 25693]PHO19454.1 MarR family transcriptional regulator [Malaciobacter molluscorum LMG 25693]
MEKLKTALIDLQCEMVAQRNMVNPDNISWLQYDILYQLNKQKEILPSALSTTIGTSRTKLSKALKELKILDYIYQYPNKLDGRELYTSITKKGSDLLDSISKEHNCLYETTLQALTKEEQDRFEELALKVSKALKEKRVNNYE